ncbi:MAG: Rieske 2Fe-2S domain-containing protein [Burkholderiaceae bacterium]
MLSHQDNERLVRVGPGTPMGTLMRAYWIPFLPSADLERDGTPVRVRLLGEDLVAFRDTQGRVGLVDHACPHRAAPMVFGRNEEGGLRCVYHGWKFAYDGSILDTPAEPEGSLLRKHLKIPSYPCVERMGVVWTWMGPADREPPPLPDFEWNMVPAENRVLTFRIQECNWLQALEGEIDSAHAPVLHGRIDGQGEINGWIAARNLRPSFHCLTQPFGLSIASRRELDEHSAYWRVNQFLMPFFTLVPPQAKYSELSGHAWVPIDDENTLAIMFSYHPSQPMYPRSREVMENGHAGRETGHASVNAFEPDNPMQPFAKYRTRFRRDNGYRFDPELQRTAFFSGLPGLWVQDAACQSGVDRIVDRTKEHLGVTDTGIQKTRRLLLDHLKTLEASGALPAGVDDAQTTMVRAVSITLTADTDWATACAEIMRAKPGQDFGYDLSDQPKSAPTTEAGA